MASAELDRILEQQRQNRVARQMESDSTRAKPLDAERRLGCTFCAGARVFDRVTGLEGEVLGGTRENVIIPTT